MIIEAVAKYLEDEGVGTRGTDIFIGEIPLDETDAIGLVYSPSPGPNQAIDVYEQVIDVWGRFKKTDDGYDKMKEVFDLLHKNNNYTITDGTESYHVYFSNAMGMIDDMERDTERRRIYKLSLRFFYREITD